MGRDYQKEVGEAVKTIFATHGAEKELAADYLAHELIDLIRGPQRTGLQGDAVECTTAKREAPPDFWQWAGKRYFNVLYTDLLRSEMGAFADHLTCDKPKKPLKPKD
jgi:hypothetical protein